MSDISKKGVYAGAITWMLAVSFESTQAACVISHTCGAGDLVLISVISLGFLAPAWFVAVMVTALWPDKS